MTPIQTACQNKPHENISSRSACATSRRGLSEVCPCAMTATFHQQQLQGPKAIESACQTHSKHQHEVDPESAAKGGPKRVELLEECSDLWQPWARFRCLLRPTARLEEDISRYTSSTPFQRLLAPTLSISEGPSKVPWSLFGSGFCCTHAASACPANEDGLLYPCMACFHGISVPADDCLKRPGLASANAQLVSSMPFWETFTSCAQ